LWGTKILKGTADTFVENIRPKRLEGVTPFSEKGAALHMAFTVLKGTFDKYVTSVAVIFQNIK
jgi:hypothetical protein